MLTPKQLSSFLELAEELKLLKDKLWTEAKTDAEKREVGAIIEAETGARKKNKPKVIEALKKAGKWTGDVATKIGASIVAKLIAGSLGL